MKLKIFLLLLFIAAALYSVVIISRYKTPKTYHKNSISIIHFGNEDIKNKTAKELFVKGLKSIRDFDYSEADEYFHEALKIESMNTAILNCVGNIEAASGDYGSAMMRFKLALKLDSNYFNTYVNMGLMYNDYKKYNAALEIMRRATYHLKLQAEEGILMANCIQSYIGLKDCESA